MGSLPIFVGLDYHQSEVQVCVMDQGGEVLSNRGLPNDVRRVAEYVGQQGCVLGAAVECCEGATNFVEALVAETGWSVHLAHPGYVRRMRQNPDKTDYSDARLLADLERVGYVPRVWLAPEPIRELRRVVRYRRQLVDQRRAVKLRIRSLLREHRQWCAGTPWGSTWLQWIKVVSLAEQSRWLLDQHLEEMQRLTDCILGVEGRLEGVTGDDEVVRKLRTMPGIGPVTAWTLRAEVGRFERFRSGKQLARFCGLSPWNRSSGHRQSDAGLIPACNSDLRSVLIEAAHRLKLHDPWWSALAEKLREAGKPGSVIAAAVANRWVRWLYREMTSAKAA